MNTKYIMKMNILALVILTLVSCGDRRSKLSIDKGEQYLSKAKVADQSSRLEEVQMMAPPGKASPEIVVERKLIKDGTLIFETRSVVKSKTEIERICKELGAYISSESQTNDGGRLQYNQVIRVPANHFDELVEKVVSLGTRIDSREINTQDVTEEFIDVEARLKTKKELEGRYREILKQAKTVTEILSIETQIGNVRSEIESMEGRLNYLKNQVSFSTLNATYYEIIGTDFGFSSKLLQSLRNGWDNLLGFMITLFNIWPFMLIASGMGWWFIRWRKRRQTKASTNTST